MEKEIHIQDAAGQTAGKCSVHSHEHGHSHGHGHEHSHGGGMGVWNIIVSLVLLAGGIVMDNIEGIAWFSEQTVRLAWYGVAFLPVGIPVMKEALEAISAKDVFNEFTLMSIAAIGAFCIGEYPEAVTVMLFYSIGEALQHKAVDKASRNISELLDVRPEHARVLRGSIYKEVSPEEVVPGETIEIRPGERLPLDGELIDDEAFFDTSTLTGESMPRSIKAGETVLAGMIAGAVAVHVRVTKPYDQSEIARILNIVKEAADRKAPAEQFIRKFARVYTPTVTLAAALLVAVPAIVAVFADGFDYVFADWLYRGLVFLVISCPCALVISVPLGYFAGIGAASKRGILFKGGNYLDAITRVTDIAFDKTGTLTSGKFQVTSANAAEGFTENELLTMVASAERKSTHPIAKAIMDHVTGRGIKVPEPEKITEVPGHGTEVKVNSDTILAGNAKLLEKAGVSVPENNATIGGTIVYCAMNGKYTGMLILADSLKEDAQEAVSRLKAAGISNVCMLSGDKEEIVKAYSGKLGLTEAYGGLLPEDKAAYVEKLAAMPDRSVAFVGDGMNDAPVLALSNVGIAMGGLGSDAAIESADIVIQTDQPSKVATAVAIGRGTRRIVMENIIGAIAIKIVILVLGALGFASMWMAVFADVGVALLAVLNSMRALVKKF